PTSIKNTLCILTSKPIQRSLNEKVFEQHRFLSPSWLNCANRLSLLSNKWASDSPKDPRDHDSPTTHLSLTTRGTSQCSTDPPSAWLRDLTSATGRPRRLGPALGYAYPGTALEHDLACCKCGLS